MPSLPGEYPDRAADVFVDVSCVGGDQGEGVGGLSYNKRVAASGVTGWGCGELRPEVAVVVEREIQVECLVDPISMSEVQLRLREISEGRRYSCVCGRFLCLYSL